jgi:hypothetical protein
MKRKMKGDHTITSLPKLITAIKMWEKNMPLAYFQKLADSVPRRIKEIIFVYICKKAIFDFSMPFAKCFPVTPPESCTMVQYNHI